MITSQNSGKMMTHLPLLPDSRFSACFSEIAFPTSAPELAPIAIPEIPNGAPRRPPTTAPVPTANAFPGAGLFFPFLGCAVCVACVVCAVVWGVVAELATAGTCEAREAILGSVGSLSSRGFLPFLAVLSRL